MSDLEGNVVAVTGATGMAGRSVVRRLLDAGARVIGAGTHRGRLDDLAASIGPSAERFSGSVVDLLDETATREWAAEIVRQNGRVDGLIHLVGGWRGHRSFPEISTADTAWLYDQLVRALQHVTLAFHDHLAAGDHGRFAVVSATAVDRPTAGGAAYAAAKAAAEAWVRALAASFEASRAAHRGQADGAAAVIFVVRMLVDEGMRARSPESSFAGATDVADLAEAVIGLWETEAAFLNGSRIVLTP